MKKERNDNIKTKINWQINFNRRIKNSKRKRKKKKNEKDAEEKRVNRKEGKNVM